jgi:multidrug resistance efflux pump
VAIVIGVALMGASLGFARVALHGTAEGNGGGEPAGPGASTMRAVAIAYVDVEDGVVSLYPTKPGRVAEVWTGAGQKAAEGKVVEAGQELFRMDDTLEKLQRKEARADLDASKEKLAHAQRLVKQHEESVVAYEKALDALNADVTAAQKQHEKAQKRHKEGLFGVTREDVDAAEAVVEKAKAAAGAGKAKLEAFKKAGPEAAVKLATIDVRAKQTQYDKAEYALKECTVRAPAKGTVLRSYVRVGEALGPNPRTAAVSFCPTDKPRIVRAEVEQEFANRVFVNQLARIQDDTTGAGDWRGKVTHIGDWYTHRRSILVEPLQFNDVRTLECIIHLEPGSGHLRIGQRVRVTLEKGE